MAEAGVELENKLTVEDFNVKVTEPKDYKGTEPVTRENFNSFLIKSFAVSRGQYHSQITYFRWIKEKNGFDYVPTLKNFIEAGGWNTFSDQEKEKFNQAFARVGIHGSFPYEDPETALPRELRQLFDKEKIKRSNDFINEHPNFGLMTEAELTKALWQSGELAGFDELKNYS